jgi:peptide/nickel transport system permease protein
MGWLLISATIVILFNLIADLLYGVLDPRIRHA